MTQQINKSGLKLIYKIKLIDTETKIKSLPITWTKGMVIMEGSWKAGAINNHGTNNYGKI